MGEPVRGKAFTPLLFTTDLCQASLSTVRPFHRTNQTDVSERSGAPHRSLRSIFHVAFEPLFSSINIILQLWLQFSPLSSSFSSETLWQPMVV